MKAIPHGLADASATEMLALLEVMYLVATADGYFSPEERRAFVEQAESLSEGKLDTAHLRALVDSWVRVGIGGDPTPRLVELRQSLPDETARRIAYGLASQMAESDGQHLEAESTILNKIARAFGLDHDDSEDIERSVRMSRRPQPV